jgi:hypothetical protein
MGFFTTPTSYRLNAVVAGNNYAPAITARSFSIFPRLVNDHESHPALGHLILLVFEAVMEVVCVSLPGYIVARSGGLNAEQQKFLANLNVALFTPCLIFTKLASQLTADKLLELAVIPVIFCVQTLVSYLVSVSVSRSFGLGKRPSNFVTAMGVSSSSNAFLSLMLTILGLWKLEFSTHLSRHLIVANPAWSTLG